MATVLYQEMTGLMDKKIIEQLREEAKDALIHWAKVRTKRLFRNERCLGEIF